MQVSWESGFDQRVFMARLAKLHDAGGAIGFDGEWIGLLALLRSMVKFSEELPWGTRHDLLTSAVHAALKVNATTPKDLLHQIQLATKAYAAKAKSSFVMYTSINALPSNKLPSVRIGHADISFLNTLPAPVLAVRSKLFGEHRRWLSCDREPNFKALKVVVEARDIEEAATKCLNAIDLVRGIWNFFMTHGWRMTLAGPRKPINALFIGPVHTFHAPSGALQTDQFWYEPGFRRNADIVDLDGENRTRVQKASKVKRMLGKHAYAPELENAFIRYARALDLEDHDLAIQKLWSLLEFLTDTGLASYDKTIRRTHFLYKDVPFQGQVLEHLRRYRNRSVHGGASAGDVEVEVYQMKRLVDAALKFHLGNRFKFSSFEEACNFLDLPTDMAQLQARQRNVRRAIAFRGSGSA